MMGFKSFLIEEEEKEGKKLKHLTHLEDMGIYHGHEGVAAADSILRDTEKHIEGNGSGKTNITTKYDGAPSIVYGHHPETGKFFVASKSAFNKNPKLNYTPEDIERNHGHAPGLVEKLKAALEHLPKVAPKNGVYQGDLMYTKPDVRKENGKYKFKPNTIDYSTDENSAEGKRIKAAKLGLVTHTKYKGKTLADMEATPNVDTENFKQHPDVHQINPKVDTSKAHYTPEMKMEFRNHMENARRAYGEMEHDYPEAIAGNEKWIEAHINDQVRKGGKPSVKGFLDYMKARKDKEVAALKSPAGKEKKAREHQDNIDHLEANKEHLEKLFKLHGHLQDAKNVLVRALNSSGDYDHEIAGKPTGPEGFVANRGEHSSKLVDRDEFSKLNLLGAGAFQKKPDDPKPVVYAHVRMNPPTSGHEALINKVKEEADKQGADHLINVTHSQDPEKNPLSKEQKLAHLKEMFPKMNFGSTSEEEPNLIDHLKKLNKAGHKHLTLVAGSDRVPEMQKLLDGYNGKEYNFDKINVVSSGDRDPDAEGTAGMSATKMRDHAINNRFKKFASGLPSTTKPEQAKRIFNDVKNGMDISIGPNTHPISLGRYAKRNDPIGEKARKEQNRRMAEKVIRKKK
jgi:hypothetical protein